jgi:hypothetical protein
MSYPIYYVEENDTLPILFDTFAGSTGASITASGLAVTDIEIYKDGSTTQRSSDAGYTLLDTDGLDFDTLTGIHGFSIDLSNNTDAGFFTVGPWYHVVVSAITVDTQTVSFVAAAFRIVSATRGLAGTALPNAAADAAGGLPISDAGGLDLDAKVGALTYTVAGKVDANTTHLDDTDLSADGPIPLLGIIDKGTAQSATGTTLVHRAGAAFADNTLIGASLMVLGSTQGYWQTRDITDNTLADDTSTVDTFTTTPTGTITYIAFGGPPAPVTPPDVNVAQISSDATAANNAEAFFDGTGYAGTGNTIPTVTTLTNLPAITANWLTAAGIAADAGAELADAVWEEAIADHEGTVGSVAEALATAGGSGASAADIADAVWEEAIADHEGTVGSVAEALATAGGSGASAADIADAVWDEALAGHAAAGSAGAALSDVPTTAEFEARTIAAASYFDPAVDKVFLGDGAHGGTSAGLTLENVRVAPTSDKEAVKITGYSGGTTSAYRIIAGGKNGILVNATGDDAVHLETSEANSAGLNLVGGASSGGMAGSVIGNITGNLTGNITGNITGDFTGNLSTSLAVLEADTPGRVTKNTALAAFPFKMVLSSDHATAATGLTVTATRSLDGAAFAACANAVSEISNGWYKIDLAAADLNANTVALRFSAATADTVDATIVTQPT